MTPILEVRNLKKYYPIRKGLLNKLVGTKYVVDGISFSIDKGKTLALVGESGCGKSVLLRVLLGLEDPTEGEILFHGKNTAQMSSDEIREKQRKMQMIFQDSLGALHPRFTVEKSLEEPLMINGMKDRKKRQEIVESTLKEVGLDPQYSTRYPHELSGGQRQRVTIARSLVERPELILADEPISALDVSLQAQVLNLLMDLQDEFDLAMLFVAHDLAVVRQIADDIMIMYMGQIMEASPSAAIYEDARHPYTKVLLKSAPSIAKGLSDESFHLDLKVGDTPDPANPPSGCLFHTRCMLADERCCREAPEYREITPGHFVRCHKA